jgi:RNA polymerase sigma factor (sigma-70 family)
MGLHQRMAALSSVSDASLVARCRAGDDDAWEELVRRFSRYVLAIAQQAYRMSPTDAEDVFQDVFAKTYERLGDLRSDDAVRPWIAQLTRRLCIDRIRAGGRETADPEAAEVGVDDTLDRLDEALSVQEALESMSEPCRDILDRFFRRDESYAAIGAALGLPSGTIASRISRCLGKLRDLLMEENTPFTRHEE